MKILKEGCPSKDGFHMPAEYEPHKGTILIWPKRPGSWIYGAKKAREAFADVICAIAESETVYLLVEAGELDHAQMIIEAVRKEKNYQKNYPVHYMEIASDDAWGMSDRPLLSMGRGRYGELTGVLMHGVESVTDCMQTGKRMIK
jgi:agmatine deiminase